MHPDARSGHVRDGGLARLAHAAAPTPDGLVVRRATAKDASCLSVLASQVFLDTYATDGIDQDLANEVTSLLSVRAFVDRLARRGVELHIGERAGRMVGLLDLDFAAAGPDAMAAGVEVARLYVQGPFQGRRIGRTLMAFAEQRAAAAGRPGVWLTAWAGNHRARAFYAALGYRDVGATPYVIEGKAYENRIFVKALPAAGT